MSGQYSPGKYLMPWNVVPLKHLLTGVDQGVSPQAEARLADEPGSWGVLKTGCVNHGKFRQEEHKRLPTDFVVDKSDVVALGDIIVSRASGSPDLVGSAAMVNKLNYRLILSDKLFRLRPARDTDARYLVWLLNSQWYRVQVRQAISGAEGLANNLPLSALRAFRMPLPSVGEQRSIADFLDHETAEIDALIAKQEQLIAGLSERRVSVIEQCAWRGISGGLPTAPTRLDTVSAAPAHWDRIRNKDLFAERLDVSLDGEGELLTVSHITGVTPRTMKSVNMFEAETLEGYKRVHPGDLAINTMWAWMGALGVSTYDGLVSPSYAVYSPTRRHPYVGRYYDYLYRTRSYITEMTRNSRGIVSSRLRLYPEVFLRMPVVAPPTSEQNQIADFLDAQTAKIDATIAKAEEFIALARERRAALVTEAVTGRVDVSNSEAREGV